MKTKHFLWASCGAVAILVLLTSGCSKKQQSSVPNDQSVTGLTTSQTEQSPAGTTQKTTGAKAATPISESRFKTEARGLALTGKISFWHRGQPWIMNADGTNPKQLIVLKDDNGYGKLSWSPDGKRIAFARQGRMMINFPDGGETIPPRPIYDLFYTSLDSTERNWWYEFTDNFGSSFPDWSPDGLQIAYAVDKNASLSTGLGLPNYQIELHDLKSSKTRTLTAPKVGQVQLQAIQPAFSPDGKKIAVCVLNPGPTQLPSLVGIVVDEASGFRKTGQEWLQEAVKIANAYGASWSPDGRWLAYVTARGVDPGLYIARPDGSQKRQIVANKPTELEVHTVAPAWSPDGKWVAYSLSDSTIHLVNIATGEKKRLSGPGDYYPAWTK